MTPKDRLLEGHVEDERVDRSYWHCGVRIDAVPLDAAVEMLLETDDTGRAVHLCTTHTLALAAHEPEFASRLNRAYLNLPDGMPLVWAARRLGIPLDRQVGGRNLMAAVMDLGRERRLRHYLYGSTPEVIADLTRNLRLQWPGVEIVAAEAPPFRPLRAPEVASTAERFRSSGADIVWIGLGTPKQDAFVDEFSGLVPATFVAVGAAFDFHAGSLPIAPAWMTEHGLEWLYRLAKEPRRLWRRYLTGNTTYARELVRRPPRRCSSAAGARCTS